MYSFLNPVLISRIIKGYVTEIDRMWRLNYEQIKKYQNRAFRKTVKNAFHTKLYKEKYKQAGVKPDDIKTVHDISKLPFVSKEDIRKYSPDGLVSSNFDKTRAIINYTSGTTGKPLSIYFDLYTIYKSVLGLIRVLKEHNVKWNKTKIVIIPDYSENTIETEYFRGGIMPHIKPFFKLNNIKDFHTYDDPKRVLQEIDKFQPEFLGGYPGMLRQLAILKKNGYGKNVNPRVIVSTGGILGKFTKEYIKEAFSTEVYDFYGATETGPIAFECRNKKYHIFSDFNYIEVLDDKNQPVSSDKLGHIVTTRLYGKATPIIRYTGLDDIVKLSDEKCNCGLSGELLEKIYGRENKSIVLPDGKIILPSTLWDFLGEIVYKNDVKYVERVQVIQKTLRKIEILIKIKKNQKETIPIVDRLFTVIKNEFEKTFNTDIEVQVKEKEKFKPHDPPVISEIDVKKIENKIYI